MDKINDVLDNFENENVEINIDLLDDDFVLIEGDSKTLAFLGNLFLTLSKSNDGNIHLSPTGSGQLFFNKKSKLGIYINRNDHK